MLTRDFPVPVTAVSIKECWLLYSQSDFSMKTYHEQQQVKWLQENQLTHSSLTLTIVSAKINHFLYKFNN